MFVSLINVFLAGEKLINFLVEPKKGTKWPSNLPRFENRSQALAVCKDLCKLQFMHRSEKQGKGKLVVSRIFRVSTSCILIFFLISYNV